MMAFATIRRRRWILTSILVCAWNVAAMTSAQQFSTVQLPTFQNYSLGTTVVVPDRGSAYAGGINRSYQSSSRTSVPLLPNSSRASSGGTSASGVTVSAWVHDFEEMDRQLLAEWERRQGRRANSNVASDVSRRSRSVGDINQTSPRVSDIRRLVEAERRTKLAEAKRYFESGQRLERRGKNAAARNVYRKAWKDADDDLRSAIRIRVAAIDAEIRSDVKRLARLKSEP